MTGGKPDSAKEHSVSLEDVKQLFAEEVNRRISHDRFIDRTEEREILHLAIQQGIGHEPARNALLQVCNAQGYVLESQAVNSIRKIIDTFTETDGVISQKEFLDAITILKKECQGQRTEQQCKKMVVQILEANQVKAKQGLFNHWYNAVKREVGM